VNIGDLFPQQAQPQLTAEQQAAVRAFEQAVDANGVREREVLLAWTALFCTCVPYFTRPDLQTPPGHAACLVHGQFMIAHDGRVL
jgi:hypothetical protein